MTDQFGPPPNPFGPPPGQFGPHAPASSARRPASSAPPAPMAYSPYPAVQQRGGMPGWAIALIAVVAGVFLVMVLAAVAIPTFLDQRVRAHTPQIPDRIGELTRSGDASLQRETQAVADQAVNQRGRQGAAFVDATGTRQVFVYTGAFVTPKSQAELAEYERGYWQGISSSLPEGYVVGPATAQPSLTYDGLMTCSFVLADWGGWSGPCPPCVPRSRPLVLRQHDRSLGHR